MGFKLGEPAQKTYLGDGVYADFERGMVKLTTENGLCATNAIYLEPEVFSALLRWLDADPVLLEAAKRERDEARARVDQVGRILDLWLRADGPLSDQEAIQAIAKLFMSPSAESDLNALQQYADAKKTKVKL